MNFDAALDDLLALRGQRLPFPPAGQTAVTYGAGNRGRELRRLLEQRGYRVDRFLDRGAEKTPAVEGIPCFAPDRPEARARPGEFALVGIWRPDVDLHPVVTALYALGYERVVTVYDFVEAFGSVIQAGYWQIPSAFYLRYVEKLRRLGALLADERSRRCLTELLRLRLLGDTAALRAPETDTGYIPEGLFALKDGARFLDGGAFDGDTYGQLIARGVRLGGYAAFEPDPHNYRRLTARLSQDAHRPSEVLLLPCAVWSRACTLSFSAEGSEGSAVSAGGGMTIQAVALDEALPGYRADLLKLDVEGAEPEALAGARKIISDSRPVLAVAAYHKPEHLWEIPFQIESWGLGYRFHFRYHQMGGNDFVLYALPG